MNGRPITGRFSYVLGGGRPIIMSELYLTLKRAFNGPNTFHELRYTNLKVVDIACRLEAVMSDH